jgi:hypothetical protein
MSRKPLAAVIGVVLLSATLVAAQPALDARLSSLEAKVAELQTRVAVLEGAPSATPTPPAPTATASASSAWRLVFDDQFNRAVAPGHLLDGSTDGYHTADGRFAVYKSTWLDTSKNGHYDPSIASIVNGVLDLHLHTAGGYPHVFAMTALPTGATAKGGLVSMRCEVRIRADRMVGFKGVPMCGWADAAMTNDLLLTYGEIDFPESNFDRAPSAFIHRTNASGFGDQAVFPTTVSWQDWHTYTVEWIAGVSVEAFVDGASIGKTTERIPTTAMHANYQFETWTNGVLPDPAVSGHVQIDSIRIWSRA